MEVMLVFKGLKCEPDLFFFIYIYIYIKPFFIKL